MAGVVVFALPLEGVRDAAGTNDRGLPRLTAARGVLTSRATSRRGSERTKVSASGCCAAIAVRAACWLLSSENRTVIDPEARGPCRCARAARRRGWSQGPEGLPEL